jgi:hypothetical protein
VGFSVLQRVCFVRCRCGLTLAQPDVKPHEAARRAGVQVSGKRRSVGTMTLRACMVGVWLAATTLSVGAGERITMKVSPAVAFAPANLVVRATIEADAENRAVEIVAESPDFYRSSEIQLEGDKAARTTTFEFRSLPPGTYEVRAKLYGADGQARAAVRQQVNVIATGSGDRY